MKTASIVKLLNDKEKLNLLNQLKQEKKPRLQKALSVFIKKDEPTKDELYKAIFGEKYSKAKDVNLRNEVRLLYEEIENFIVKREVVAKEHKYFKDQILLSTYAQDKESTLFETEWNRVVNGLDLRFELRTLYDLIVLKDGYLKDKASFKNGDFRKVFEFWKSHKMNVINYCFDRYIRYCFLYNALVRNLSNIEFSNSSYDTIKTESIETDDLIYKLGIENLSNYNRYWIKMTQVANVNTTLEQAIELLHEAVKLLDYGDKDNRITTYQSLSYMYFYSKNAEKAYISITKAYELLTPETITKNSNIIIVRDVIMSMHETLRIDECIVFFEKHQKILEKHLVDYIIVVNVMLMCYLRKGDFENAYKIIPTDFSKVSHYNLYNFKLSYVLILIKRREYEQAKREINNSLKMLRKVKFDFDSYTLAFEAFHKLLKRKMNPKLKMSDKEILEFTKLEPENLELFKRDFPEIFKNI